MFEQRLSIQVLVLMIFGLMLGQVQVFRLGQSLGYVKLEVRLGTAMLGYRFLGYVRGQVGQVSRLHRPFYQKTDPCRRRETDTHRPPGFGR